MPNPIRVRLAGLWKHSRVVIVLIVLALIVIVPVGYYLASFYSVNDVSVQIISATRALGSPINYTIEIRISGLGAIMPVTIWPLSLDLTINSYPLGGRGFGYPSPSSSDGYDHLVPGGSLTYTAFWLSSFSLNSSATSASSHSNSNYLLVSVGFHQAFAGWYNPWDGLVRTTSSTWTWNRTQ